MVAVVVVVVVVVVVEALEQSTTLGEGGATRPSMKKSSPKLSGGQKLRP